MRTQKHVSGIWFSTTANVFLFTVYAHTHTRTTQQVSMQSKGIGMCVSTYVMRDKDIKWKPEENKMLGKNSSKI